MRYSAAHYRSERELSAFLGLFVLLVRLLIKWPLKLVLILLLLLLRRPSLALYLWGKGRVMMFIRDRSGAYDQTRWRQTRKPVYWRNKREMGGGEYFVCEVTGYASYDLGEFHVDHILPRSQWPLLAHNQGNLRLVRADVNIAKSDRLCGWSLFKYIFTKRIR